MASEHCRACGGEQLARFRDSTVDFDLTSDNFSITDDHYGMTGAIDRCLDCGYLQCPEILNVTEFYEGLEDQGYESSRNPRLVQMDRLLKDVLKRGGRPPGTLLDVGAGSGILVEAARELGFEARGIEPSQWLAERARERDLPVMSGILPVEGLTDTFDWVTCIDVIEHVEDPLQLVRDMVEHLAPGGTLVVVTPDVGSLTARLLGRRWWHFRIAHIGYFTPSSLDRLMTRAGLTRQAVWRPTWYFQLGYLASRLKRYLPFDPSRLLPSACGRIQVPLNLLDSTIALYRVS